MGFVNLHNLAATAENAAADPAYRPWDRTIFAGQQDVSDAAEGSILVWQGDEIYALEGAFALKHTVASMASILTNGVHTGLYAVGGLDAHGYICGLYPGTTGMGWVRLDLRTNTWTSGVAAGTTAASGSRMSACVVKGRRIWHATNGVLTSFDPESGDLQQTTYPNGSIIDRLVSVDDRMFLVTAGSGIIVHEVIGSAVGGGVSLGPHSINIGGGGDFAVMRFAGGFGFDAFDASTGGDRFYVMFYTATGGQGSRCYKVSLTTGGFSVTETTAMVPASATYATGSTEDLRWPTATFNGQNYSWETSSDQVIYVPYGTRPPPDVLTKLVRLPLGIPIPTPGAFNTSSFTFAGEGSGMTEKAFGPNSVGTEETDHRWSVHSTWVGGGDRRFNANRPKVWLSSIERLPNDTTDSDFYVYRVRFWVSGPDLGSTLSCRLAIGEGDDRPKVNADLIPGSPAIPPGGTATWDGALERIDNLNPYDPTNGRSTLFLGSVTGGPFEVGATVQGGTSLETAVVKINANGALYVVGGSNPALSPFAIGETVTQLDFPNSGAFATLNAQPEALGQAVEHSLVWVASDAVPPTQQTLQLYIFSNAAPYDVANPPQDAPSDVIFCGYFLSSWPELVDAPTPSPTTAGGEVAPTTTGSTPRTTAGGEVIAQTTGSTPNTTAGGEVITGTGAAGGTTSAGGEVVTQGAMPNTTTAGGEVITQGAMPNTTTAGGEVATDTLLTPQLVGPASPADPSLGPGAVAFLAAGVEGSARDTVNVENSGLPGQQLTLALGATVNDLSLTLDGMVELGRAVIDCVNDPLTTTYPILDMNALGLTLAGTMRFKITATALTAPGGQPSLSLGVGGAFDNNVPTTALSLVAPDTHEELALAQPRPLLGPGDVLFAQLDALAGAASYVIEVVVYGFHRIP
jgi:hypothetical protein